MWHVYEWCVTFYKLNARLNGVDSIIQSASVTLNYFTPCTFVYFRSDNMEEIFIPGTNKKQLEPSIAKVEVPEMKFPFSFVLSWSLKVYILVHI